MNWDEVEGRWNEFAGSARAHWSQLTDQDWHAIGGSKEQLVTRISARYAIAKEEAEKQVEVWTAALLDIVQSSKAH